MQHTIGELQQYQSLSLNAKIIMTKQRIRAWVETFGEDGVFVSFSGGKDSTVLLKLVREDFPRVRAVFYDTGLEFPEIRDFVSGFENVEWIKPKYSFKQVIKRFGYPFISKEVSGSLYYAKKYLMRLEEKNNIPQASKQASKQASNARRDFARVCNVGCSWFL